MNKTLNTNIFISASTLEAISLVVVIIILAGFAIFLTFVFRHYYKKNKNEIRSSELDLDIIDNEIYLIKENKKKGKKALKITLKTLSWVVFGTVSVGFIFSVINRACGNNMMFGDSNYIVIASGSMENKNPVNTYIQENNLNNQINTYDMVEIKKVKSPSDIHLYDVVAFKANDVTIVHRVIEVLENNRYITRGDSNDLSDTNNLYGEALEFENIVGVYTGNRVPVIGMFIIFLQSNIGIMTIIALFYLLFMFDHFHNKTDEELDIRANYLINIVKDDIKIHSNVEQLKDIFVSYKDSIYRFNNGNYIEKLNELDLNMEEIPQIDKHQLLLVYKNVLDEVIFTIKDVNYEELIEQDDNKSETVSDQKDKK